MDDGLLHSTPKTATFAMLPPMVVGEIIKTIRDASCRADNA